MITKKSEEVSKWINHSKTFCVESTYTVTYYFCGIRVYRHSSYLINNVKEDKTGIGFGKS